MRHTLLLLFTLVLLTACSGPSSPAADQGTATRDTIPLANSVEGITPDNEEYKPIDNREFNESIARRTDIASPEALIRLYYNQEPEVEGNARISVESKSIGADKYQITLIHEGLQDDSQSGEKIVMTATRADRKWTVSKIKKNWKCWNGRGHTGWGTEPCQ